MSAGHYRRGGNGLNPVKVGRRGRWTITRTFQGKGNLNFSHSLELSGGGKNTRRGRKAVFMSEGG